MFDRCPALPDTPKGPVVTPLAETTTVAICKHRYAGVAHICVVSGTLHVPSAELFQFVYKELDSTLKCNALKPDRITLLS